MSTRESAFRFFVYAPALTEGDSRSVAIVRAMERALRGVHLDWTVSDDHQMVHLPRRDAWLAKGTTDGDFPFVCNNDLRYPVIISGMKYFSRAMREGHSLLRVHASLPLDAIGAEKAADVLEGIAEGAGAIFGVAQPEDIALTVAEQYHRRGFPQPAPPKGLPVLKLPEDIPWPEAPEYLSWINYWSATTVRRLGFPDPDRDAELLTRSRRTASGAWVVKLTDEPLDLDNPAHLDIVLRTYDRFPALGGRDGA